MKSITGKGCSKAVRGNIPNHEVKKRNRKPLSCASCRTRKLRCDRSLPACSNCMSRSEAASCDYSMTKNYPQIIDKSTQRSRAARDPPTPEPSETPSDADSSLDASDLREEKKVSDKLRQKLERLELLISDLMENHPACRTDKDSTKSNQNEAESGQHDGERESNDVGSSSHNIQRFNTRGGESLWSTLLTELAEVRAHIFKEKSDEPMVDPDLAPAPTLLFGAVQIMSQDEMLRQLPSRQFCDGLVETYFTSVYPALWFLHRPTFMQEYRKFWETPRKASIIWLALLFGIFRVAVSSFVHNASEPDSVRNQYAGIAEVYRHWTVQCLAQADCTRPQPHVVEALLLHLYAEYTSAKDLNPSVWVIHATIVRISMKMGYHIQSTPGLSPFQVEIRRRVWAFIRQADILVSFQVGLPSMLHGRWLQGDLPLNINDDDFGPSSTVLPQPLPDSQMTPVSYLTAKARLALVFAEALQEADKSGNVPYAPVAALDAKLRSIYENMPQPYREMEVFGQVVENAGELTARIVLASIYNKALCVLHARYLDIVADSPQILYSRLACIHSAMALLSCQDLYNRDVVVQGRVTRLSNSLTSMTLHDFFLAATLLCKALFLEHDEGIAGTLGPLAVEAIGAETPSITIYTEDQILEALDSSLRVFDRDRVSSAEAGRACDLLSRLLQELRDPLSRSLRRGDWPFSHTQDADWLTSTRMQLDSSSILPEADPGVDPRELESWTQHTTTGVDVEQNAYLRVPGNAIWGYYTP